MTKEILKLAIEQGGYTQGYAYLDEVEKKKKGKAVTLNFWASAVVATSAEFWQALGRAKGWSEAILGEKEDIVPPRALFPLWKFHALSYIEILLTQGTEKADQYLTGLLQ